MDTNDKEAKDLQENKAADEVVQEPPVLKETEKGKNIEQRNGDKVAKEREGPKGLPHHQVPQPLVDFSSEALEQLWYLQSETRDQLCYFPLEFYFFRLYMCDVNEMQCDGGEDERFMRFAVDK